MNSEFKGLNPSQIKGKLMAEAKESKPPKPDAKASKKEAAKAAWRKVFKSRATK